jgi:hypothetical protein
VFKYTFGIQYIQKRGILMGLFSFLKGKAPEQKIPIPPSPGMPSRPQVPTPSFQPIQPDQAQRDAGQAKSFFSDEPDFSIPFKFDEEEKQSPSFPPAEEEFGQKKIRQVDDFGLPMSDELELPSFDVPKFKFMPSGDEKAEINRAIEDAERGKPLREISLPKKQEDRKKQKSVPEELPEIGEKARPSFMMPEEVEEPVELREIPKSKGPVFIRADNFLMVRKGVNSIKDNLKNMEDRLMNLNEIKSKQDADLDSWHSAVEAIQRKLVYVDKSLFEK